VEVKQREDEDGDSRGEQTTTGDHLVNVRHEDWTDCSQRSPIYNKLFLGCKRRSMGIGAGDYVRYTFCSTAVATLVNLLENDLVHGGDGWWKGAKSET
jgi:hypothetical protein